MLYTSQTISIFFKFVAQLLKMNYYARHSVVICGSQLIKHLFRSQKHLFQFNHAGLTNVPSVVAVNDYQRALVNGRNYHNIPFVQLNVVTLVSDVHSTWIVTVESL